jgi:hypothetical protein
MSVKNTDVREKLLGLRGVKNELGKMITKNLSKNEKSTHTKCKFRKPEINITYKSPMSKKDDDKGYIEEVGEGTYKYTIGKHIVHLVVKNGKIIIRT